MFRAYLTVAFWKRCFNLLDSTGAASYLKKCGDLPVLYQLDINNERKNFKMDLCTKRF